MATAARPVPHTIHDFNKILDQKIDFLDNEGSEIKTSFYSALHYAPESAQKLLERLNSRITYYKTAEDRSAIAEELRTFQGQRDHFAAVVALARTVVEQFTEMNSSLDKTSKSHEARPIMVEGDVAEVSRKITNLANTFEKAYLTAGWVSSHTIPGRLNRLEGLQGKA